MPIPYHPWSFTASMLSDPFVLFCLGCLVTPLIVVGTAEDDGPLGTIALRGFDAGVWKAYWTDKAVLAGAAFAAAAALVAGDYPALPDADRRSANWYLANGAIIHIAMDGLTGGYGCLPLMNDNYEKLDNRANGWGAVGTNGLTEDAVSVAYVVFRSELYIMAPLCFLTYIAHYARSPYRPSLAIVTLSAQLWGTVMFVGPEILTGCKNMVPVGVDGCLSAGTTPYELLYFWFAVGANVLWIVVPLLMIKAEAEQIVATAQLASAQPAPGRTLAPGPGRGSVRARSVAASSGGRGKSPAGTADVVAPHQWCDPSSSQRHTSAATWPSDPCCWLCRWGEEGLPASSEPRARSRSPSASPARSKSRSPSPVARRTRKSTGQKKK